jgi:F-type H+-transporting ATPase subunit O
MASLNNTFKKDTRLQKLITAPTLSGSDKEQIVNELLKTIGGQDKDNVVKNFLSTLAENNRLGVLEAVTDNFATLMGAARGEVELTVTSAAVWKPGP